MDFTTIKAKVLAFFKFIIVTLNGLTLTQRFKKLKKTHQILIGLVILILGIWYFVKGGQGPMTPPPPKVIVQEMSPKDVPLEYEYAGRVSGSREIELRARVGGILLERTYAEGQAVKQGDILFKIDPASFQAKADQAEAKLKEEQATLKQTEQGWQRVLDLHTKKMASTREKDEAVSAFERAKAKVQGAEADFKRAKIDLDYTTVKAPISGITSQEAVSEGSLIDATFNPTLLTRIVQIDPVYVKFSYSESEILRHRHLVTSRQEKAPLNEKLVATLRFGDGTVYPVKGDVNFTDSIIDPQTGTVQARAVIPNPESNLLPGQFVRITISGLTQSNAFIVPKRAVMQGPMGPFVYLVNAEGKAAMQPIALGLSTSQGQIIEKGLKAGDKVITDGMIKVRPDTPVTIEKPTEEKTDTKDVKK
ncbi:MAG: efflux RND transporter periplasmic adaptor subunit [Alphaproteobacteria bacterium]|nr:efflux RND transporter periplasmic adaptor subunit [Alphaproteobacteria bacterium]